jgi:CubicO group peptidase (beta-lactamase class C family)
LFATRQLDLDLPVTEALPEWRRADGAGIRIRDLLTHASGLPPHLPLYEYHSGVDAMVAAIAAVPLVTPPRTTAIYSDLGFIVLGRVLERIAASPLNTQVTTLLAEATTVPPSFGNASAGVVVGTGRSAWRGRLLIGEVHDDNAAAMGGVAGHAGLFGCASAVGDLARMVLCGLRGEDTALAPSWTIRAFARRSPVPGSSRALAWDTALPTSSSGRFLSTRAIGHTGFTGTSLWIDPERDRYVVLLTNRTAGRATAADMAVIRRDVHDILGAAWIGSQDA